MDSPCSQIQNSLKNLLDLRTQFAETYSRVDENKDRHDPENKQAIEYSLALMEETKLAQELLNLQLQYASQKKILYQTSLLESFPDDEEYDAIEGIDREVYPIPTLEQFTERIKAKREMVKNKYEQGFTKLILVPFGMPLSILIMRYAQLLNQHNKENTLFSTDGTKLDLEVDNPVFFWDGYLGLKPNKKPNKEIIYEADRAGDLIYFPNNFDKDDHQGKTKLELLKEENGSQAWQILLLEDLPDLPAENKGKTIKDRKQLEANKTPNDYLKAIQTQKQYQSEQGLTLESWLIYAITQLQEKNQAIDDYQGQGKACYLTGSYQKKFGSVPYAYWSRVDRQAELSGSYPGFPRGRDACRSGVMI